MRRMNARANASRAVKDLGLSVESIGVFCVSTGFRRERFPVGSLFRADRQRRQRVDECK